AQPHARRRGDVHYRLCAAVAVVELDPGRHRSAAPQRARVRLHVGERSDLLLSFVPVDELGAADVHAGDCRLLRAASACGLAGRLRLDEVLPVVARIVMLATAHEMDTEALDAQATHLEPLAEQRQQLHADARAVNREERLRPEARGVAELRIPHRDREPGKEVQLQRAADLETPPRLLLGEPLDVSAVIVGLHQQQHRGFARRVAVSRRLTSHYCELGHCGAAAANYAGRAQAFQCVASGFAAYWPAGPRTLFASQPLLIKDDGDTFRWRFQ